MKTVGNQNMKALLNLAVGKGEGKWRKKEVNSYRGMGRGGK